MSFEVSKPLSGEHHRAEISDIPQSRERGPEAYEYFLGVSLSEMATKHVINIGSGKTGLFEKAAAKGGADVFTVSPYFADPGPGGARMRIAYTEKNLSRRLMPFLKRHGRQSEVHPIATRIEDGIPLVSASMDIALALYSVPLYLSEDTNTYEDFFREINRILRNGGHASLYPIPESKRGSFDSLLDRLKMNRREFVQIAEDPADRTYPNEICYRLEIDK